MNLFESLTLLGIMGTLALLPSTSVILVITRSSTAGFANGAAVAAGITLGDLVFASLAILGMTALAGVMGSFFLVLRYVAAAYLIWLGISLLKAKPQPTPHARPVTASTLSTSFLSGFLLTLGDVKAIFFYASLFPALVDPAAVEPSDVAVILVLTLVAVGGVKLAYAYSARKVTSLASGFKLERGAKIAAGGFMVGAGTCLAIKA